MSMDEIARKVNKIGREMRHLTAAAAYANICAVGALARLTRPLARINYSRGDRHIDEVCQSILRGEPGYTTSDPEVRLHAAAAFAEVLDR